MNTVDLKKELPLPGELVNVNNRKVHILRSGMGFPTVLFESGLAGTLLTFAKVQPEIAKFTSTLSYDRAGLGYSEKSANPKRISAVIASELYELLVTLDLHEPLVLVGWSAGGIYLREFAYQYPDMVAGMVFIDSSHESQGNRYPEEIALNFRQDDDDEKAFISRLSKITQEEILKTFADSPPWKNKHPDTHPYFADQVRPELFEYYLELLSFFEHETNQDKRALRSLNDIPLIVISRSKTNFPVLSEEQNNQVAKIRHELQNELARLSTIHRHIEVESGHDIANEKPEIIIEFIKEMIQQIRERK